MVTTCPVLGFSTQAFYKWRNRPYSDSEWNDAHLINELKDLHADDPEFGYRLLRDELVAGGDLDMLTDDRDFNLATDVCPTDPIARAGKTDVAR